MTIIPYPREIGDISISNGTIFINGKGIIDKNNSEITDASLMNNWLQAKKNSGTPVVVDYVLSEQTEENIEIPSIPNLTGNITYSIDTTIKPSSINYTTK